MKRMRRQRFADGSEQITAVSNVQYKEVQINGWSLEFIDDQFGAPRASMPTAWSVVSTSGDTLDLSETFRPVSNYAYDIDYWWRIELQVGSNTEVDFYEPPQCSGSPGGGGGGGGGTPIPLPDCEPPVLPPLVVPGRVTKPALK